MNYSFYKFIIFLILFVALIISFLFYFIVDIVYRIKRLVINKDFQDNVIENLENRNKDMPAKKLVDYNIDNIDQLKEYLANQFIEFEKAYNNLDYNLMRELSTSLLFNNYYTGITLDLKFGYKRIINDIKKEKVTVYDICNEDDKQIISSVIKLSYINYKINREGTIVSGDNEKRDTELFEVIFERPNLSKNIFECPQCGAEIDGFRCKYCRKTVIDDKFRMNSIKRIINDKR